VHAFHGAEVVACEDLAPQRLVLLARQVLFVHPQQPEGVLVYLFTFGHERQSFM
jgi:hypothetical protein